MGNLMFKIVVKCYDLLIKCLKKIKKDIYYTSRIARYACSFLVWVENVTDGRTDAQKKGSKT